MVDRGTRNLAVVTLSGVVLSILGMVGYAAHVAQHLIGRPPSTSLQALSPTLESTGIWVALMVITVIGIAVTGGGLAMMTACHVRRSLVAPADAS